MSIVELVRQIESLPEESQREVEKFIQVLSEKSQRKIKSMKELKGVFKGKIFLSPDFDEPLEDFKDYM